MPFLQTQKVINLTNMSQIRMPDIHSFDLFLASAHAFADAAATETIRFFRQSPPVEDKSQTAGYAGTQRGFDPVTAADKAAEEAIRRELAARFADHGMHGEEFGILNPEARFRWIVDPIDGTAAYIMGWPMWGTLIALTDNGMPVLGLMDQPFTKERFWSEATHSYCRGPDGFRQKLSTRPCESLQQAVLSTTHPDFFCAHDDREAFFRVKRAARTTRYGGDCYAYAMLASGLGDLIIESGLKPYDVAALIPIIERAGGVISTWSGEAALQGGNIVAAGDPRVHEAAIELLNA